MSSSSSNNSSSSNSSTSARSIASSSRNSNNTGSKKINRKLHIMLIFALSIVSFILSLFISNSIEYGYCNKSTNNLCNEPSTETIDDIDYMTCKNKNKFKPHDFSHFINIVILPVAIPLIISSIGYLIYEYIANNKTIYIDYITIFNVVLVIILIVQLIMYAIYKKSCLQSNYKCNLKYELKMKDNNKGYMAYACVPDINILSNINYNIIKNTNHILYSIVLFIILLLLYKIDTIFNLISNTGNKLSKRINDKVFTIIAIIIFITNLFVPKIARYIINIIIIILFIIILICLKYIPGRSVLNYLHINGVCKLL